MNEDAQDATVIDFVNAKLAEAPPLTNRQLDRLGSLVRQPQAETKAAA